ncbi:MAG: VanZ family protein [Planctomycetota bacterium]
MGDRLARVPRAVGGVLAVLWAGFVWSLSGGPPPEVPLTAFWSYVLNLAHAPLFAVFAVLLALALPRTGERGWPALGGRERALVLAAVLGYGVVDEWHQSFRPDRVASWTDVVTDLAGAASTLAVAAYVARFRAGAGGLAVRLVLGVAACAAAAWVAAFL